MHLGSPCPTRAQLQLWLFTSMSLDSSPAPSPSPRAWEACMPGFSPALRVLGVESKLRSQMPGFSPFSLPPHVHSGMGGKGTVEVGQGLGPTYRQLPTCPSPPGCSCPHQSPLTLGPGLRVEGLV